MDTLKKILSKLLGRYEIHKKKYEELYLIKNKMICITKWYIMPTIYS